jgi:hypothetical protein
VHDTVIPYGTENYFIYFILEERVAGREDRERHNDGLLQQGHQDYGHRHQVLPR